MIIQSWKKEGMMVECKFSHNVPLITASLKIPRSQILPVGNAGDPLDDPVIDENDIMPPEALDESSSTTSQEAGGNPLRIARGDPSQSETEAENVGQNKAAKNKHNLFTHFPKDPKCQICIESKTQRTQCRRQKKKDFEEGNLSQAAKFADKLTVDHAIIGEGSESRKHCRVVLVIQDLSLIHI